MDVEAESQEVTRPSEFVVAVNVGVELEDDVGEIRVRVQRIFAAGLPATVSRTWQVIQGRVSWAAIVVGGGWCFACEYALFCATQF